MDNGVFLNIGAEFDNDFFEIALKNRLGPNRGSIAASDLAGEDHVGRTNFFFFFSFCLGLLNKREGVDEKGRWVDKSLGEQRVRVVDRRWVYHWGFLEFGSRGRKRCELLVQQWRCSKEDFKERLRVRVRRLGEQRV